jgi:DNA-binding MarR family transcriptional regulator
MVADLKNSIDLLADEIREQAKQLGADTFLSFVEVTNIIDRYLDILNTGLPASRPGFDILIVLILNGGTMTPTEISKSVLRSKHTVTRVVDTLEKQGLLRRLPLGVDRRVREVSITRKGIGLIKRHSIEIREKIIKQVFESSLDEKQMLELREIIKRLKQHLLSLIPELQNDWGN